LAKAVGKKGKEVMSVILYTVAIISAFFVQWLAQALYILVAIMWLIPDQRVERVASNK